MEPAKLNPNDGFTRDVEDAIEKAFWSYQAMIDPTQGEFTYGNEFAFKQAVRGLFVSLRKQ